MEFDLIPAIYIGGGLFFIVILFAGMFTQGYSRKYQSISELGILGTKYGWLVRWVGFVPLGASFVIFAWHTRDLFSNPIPLVFFILIGVSILFAGIFPTDPDNRRDTASGKIHASAVIMLMMLLSTIPFLFSISAVYRKSPTGGFLFFSFLMGMFLLVLLVHSSTDILQRLKASFRKTSDVYNETPKRPLGLQQRILLLGHYIWWFVFTRVL